jgi:hypothetical protein
MPIEPEYVLLIGILITVIGLFVRTEVLLQKTNTIGVMLLEESDSKIARTKQQIAIVTLLKQIDEKLGLDAVGR